jgi:hypothetical protein
MANIFANLPVPDAPGIGAAVLTAGFGPDKNLIIEGPGGEQSSLTGANGIVVVEVSEDGLHYAPFCKIDLLKDPHVPPFSVVSLFMRARRFSGFGTVVLGIGGETTTSNLFAALAVPPSGIGVATNVSALGARKTLSIVGPYAGDLVIEGSVDAGVTYDPILTCNYHNSATYVFDGVWQFMRVRRLGSLTGTPAAVIGGHPASGSGGTGANSCVLAFSGTHTIPGANGVVPDPCIGYFANSIFEYSETPWPYYLPAAGTASGFRVHVAYNNCNGVTTASLINGVTVTTQSVTIPPATTGTFITAGASAVYALNDTMQLMFSTAGDYGEHTIIFGATALFTI